MTLQLAKREENSAATRLSPAVCAWFVGAIKKTDEELQIVWGEVYAPDFPDSQGDFMTRETIREMAYGFMRKGNIDAIDTNHDREPKGSYVVESFIARDQDPDFIAGSWVLAVKCCSDDWASVKSGELNGFSIDGRGVRVEATLEITIPDILKGETDEGTDGDGPHKHDFFVKLNDDGDFIGGETSASPDGHRHPIVKGTVTEPAGNPQHTHRFSFVEGVLDVHQIAA